MPDDATGSPKPPPARNGRLGRRLARFSFRELLEAQLDLLPRR